MLKSAPTTYMFPELGRNGKRLSTTSSLHLCLALVTTRGSAQHKHPFLLMNSVVSSFSEAVYCACVSVLCAADSCSVGVVLDGASAEELRLLDSFLQAHSLLRTSADGGEVAPGSSKMADALEDPTWGGTLAKVHLPRCDRSWWRGEGGGRRERGGEGRRGGKSWERPGSEGRVAI